MKTRNSGQLGKRNSQGMALIFVLVMMGLVFSIVAISARMSTMGERVGASERDRQIALQGAEAALVDAEMEISEPITGSRSCQLHYAAFETGCSVAVDSRGLCAPDAVNPDKPLYKLVNFEELDDDLRKYVRFGEYTNRSFDFSADTSTTTGLSDVGKPAASPKYIIERRNLSTPLTGVDQSGNPRAVRLDLGAYVVTAIGYGFSKRTQVMLQAVVVHPKPANRCAGSTL